MGATDCTLVPGTRIEIIEMVNESDPVPPGTQGTVKEVCPHTMGRGEPWTQVWVDWDNGRGIAMILPDDKYRVIDALKRPEDFFTNPQPSSMMAEAKKAIDADEVCCGCERPPG